jgi:chorismate synthase
MGSNRFGNLFQITTWGESHGKAIGVVIDGCPAGLPLTEEEINLALALRKPGRNRYTTPRAEGDRAEIFSGLFEGKTTGAPISIVIFNHDADPSKYAPIKHLLRPGHANYTYLEKYGIFDYRGGGRASARETACRVAAGAVASRYLSHFGIEVVAYIKEIGGVSSDHVPDREAVEACPLFCGDGAASTLMMKQIERAQTEGDSLGGIIECVALNLPVGLGDPVYEKLEANLAKAMLSIPASKGIEFGAGFTAARMRGSEHNDLFTAGPDGTITTQTNHAGGTLGGISTGEPLLFRVAFKPPSSIKKAQETLDLNGAPAKIELPEGSRHDPCVAIRAVPVVSAMAALVLADAHLQNRTSVISP